VHNVKSNLEPISAVGVAAEQEHAMKYIDSTLREELAVLGLDADADRDAVIHAYRRLAKESHPDLTAAQDAAARFDAVTAAYRHVLDLVPARTAEAVPHVIHQVVVSSPVSFYLPDASLTRGAVGRQRPAIVVGPVRMEPLPTHPPTSGESTGGRTGSRAGGPVGRRTQAGS
jgi:hypothetical protein